MESITLSFVVQPPTEAKSNIPLYPFPTIRLNSQGEDLYKCLDKYDAVVTFVQVTNEGVSDENLPEVPNKQRGRLIDSAHPLPLCDAYPNVLRSGDQAYYHFNNLQITEAGKYKIRVNLMRKDLSTNSSIEPSKVTYGKAIFSRCISVGNTYNGENEPSDTELAFLKMIEREDLVSIHPQTA